METLGQKLLKIRADLAEVAVDVVAIEGEPKSHLFEHPSFEGQIRVEMSNTGLLLITSTLGRNIRVLPHSSDQIAVQVGR